MAFGGNNCSGEIHASPALNAHGGPGGRMDFATEALVVVPGDEAALLDWEPQCHRVQADQSTAMTSNGTARVADPVDTARSLDTCGGFATNQGGNIVAHLSGESPAEWVPDTSTALRARDCKGTPDSDCTQTLLDVDRRMRAAGAGTGEPIAFNARQDPDSGSVCGPLDTDGHTAGILDPGPEGGFSEDGDACFVHCNKGRPDGRKSAHTEMVTVKDRVETLTTDGHSQSAVALRWARDGALPVEATPDDEGDGEPVSFCAKDYGGDAGNIAPTLRAGPHVESHENSGVHVGIVLIHPDAGGRGGFLRTIGVIVRRLTPRECLSLQGFPTGYLDGVRIRGKPLPDGPRFKLCGNSWAVPVVRWVFARLDARVREQIRAEGDSEGGRP